MAVLDVIVYTRCVKGVKIMMLAGSVNGNNIRRIGNYIRLRNGNGSNSMRKE